MHWEKGDELALRAKELGWTLDNLLQLKQDKAVTPFLSMRRMLG